MPVGWTLSQYAWVFGLEQTADVFAAVVAVPATAPV